MRKAKLSNRLNTLRYLASAMPSEVEHESMLKKNPSKVGETMRLYTKQTKNMKL